jgi:hypothetical protein
MTCNAYGRTIDSLTEGATAMTKGQPISHSKPSPAQVTLLTAAVTNNGYLTADLATGRTRRTYQACADRGWMTTDHRITIAGRDALRRHNAAAYAKALPAAHVDLELNRIAGQPTAPLGGPLGSPAHVLAIPDTWIQYDVEPGSVASFVGYSINTRDGLRTIMDVEYDRNRTGWVDGARIFLPDNKGGIQFTGTVYSEIQVYGPAGGPDLRSHSGKLLDSARQAHEKTLTDRMPVPTEVAPGHGLIIDADRGGNPIEFPDWKAPSVEAATAMLDEMTAEMRDRQAALTALEKSGAVWVTTGNGKSQVVYEELRRLARDSSNRPFHLIDLNGAAGLLPRAAQLATPAGTGTLPDPGPATTMASNHTPLPAKPLNPDTHARMDKTIDRITPGRVNAATHARLAPAVDPGQLRHQVEQIRDAIVARIGDRHGIAGPVDHARYRLRLHYARIATHDEAARDALMKLEIAISEIERGATNIAKTVLDRAHRRLTRR